MHEDFAADLRNSFFQKKILAVENRTSLTCFFFFILLSFFSTPNPFVSQAIYVKKAIMIVFLIFSDKEINTMAFIISNWQSWDLNTYHLSAA